MKKKNRYQQTKKFIKWNFAILGSLGLLVGLVGLYYMPFAIKAQFGDLPDPPLNWPTSWITTPSQCSDDPLGDSNPSLTDMVGDAANPPSGYNTDANYIYFRFRLAANPGGGGGDFNSDVALNVLFQTKMPPNENAYQFVVDMYGVNDEVRFWQNTVEEVIMDYSGGQSDKAELLLTPVGKYPAKDYARVVGSSGRRYYVDFALPLSELAAVGLPADTYKHFTTGTQNNNRDKKDYLNCYDRITDLAIYKTDSMDPMLVNNPFAYSLTVINQGPKTAQNIKVTDTLPDWVTCSSTNPSTADCDGFKQTLTWDIDSLLAGASKKYYVYVSAGDNAANTIVTDTAKVDSSSALDFNQVNNVDTENTQICPLGTVAE